MNKRLMSVVLVVWVAMLLGCATFDRNAYKTVAAMEVSVETAMRSWHNYVDFAKVQPEADQAQILREEGQVAVAFTKYRKAMNLVYDVRLAFGAESQTGKPLYEQAFATASTCAEQLINTVNALLK